MSSSSNSIEVYQNNTKSLTCIVYGLDVTGFTPYLTVKNLKDASILINKTGTVIDSSVAVFNLSSIDTSLEPGNYIYDITFEQDSSIYTVVKDSFIVIDGVRY